MLCDCIKATVKQSFCRWHTHQDDDDTRVAKPNEVDAVVTDTPTRSQGKDGMNEDGTGEKAQW
jgi:hypothetical protein